MWLSSDSGISNSNTFELVTEMPPFQNNTNTLLFCHHFFALLLFNEQSHRPEKEDTTYFLFVYYTGRRVLMRKCLRNQYGQRLARTHLVPPPSTIKH